MEDDRWLDDLTAEVNRELRGRALAGADRRATREQVRDAWQHLADWQQREPLRAQGERIAQTLVDGAPAALLGGAIGVEIETGYALDRVSRPAGRAFTLYDDGSIQIAVDYRTVGGANVPIAEIVTRPALALDEEDPRAEENPGGWESPYRAYERVSEVLGLFHGAAEAARAGGRQSR